MFANDIKLSNKLDDNRNERVIIIYGDSLNDNVNKNGEIEIISSDKDNTYYHALYLKEHSKKNYTSDKDYQRCIETSSHSMNIFGAIYIQNTKYNNILFMETTEENSAKRYGMIYFPLEDISDEQMSSLRILTKKLKDFDEILVSVSPYVVDGMMDAREMFRLTSFELRNDDFDFENKIRDVYRKLGNNLSKKR